ncbi:hypothetical protein [Gorillibacterium timonense]|uniref:hypothetical protein n=1 Tax=Gorillibacterium timonense TaxID=1689269 RepID=UPI00071C8D88|nr:hypothetical protein [Gorillibacterium timonense]
MDEQRRQMPLFRHDRAQYLQEMAEWHQALATEPGNEGLFHSQRAKNYLEMLNEDSLEPSENSYY